MAQTELIGGNNSAGVLPGAEAAVDYLRGSSRVSVSPIDTRDLQGNLLGHYRTVLITGATASIGAGGLLFSCRWSGPLPPVAVITRIQAQWEVLTAVTVATPMDIEAIRYTAYTVADTGGTATTPIKMRSAFNASAFADYRVATTTALAAGTRTLDAVGFAYGAWPTLTGTNSVGTAVALPAGAAGQLQDVFKWEIGGHPLVLGVNEGFALRQSVAGTTTGTVRWTFIVEHVEVAGF